MQNLARRLLVACMAAGLVLVAAIAPATAAPSTPGEVVQWASMRNNAILSQFPWSALQASTIAELDAVHSKANYDLDVVWYQANGYLEDLLAQDPDGLADDVATAEGRLLADHNAAHAELDSMYRDVVDSLPASTTTTTQQPTTSTSTSSTTTTRPATTTTTRPTSSTTTTRATASTTTLPSTTTTVAPTTTTTTQPASIVALPTDDPRPPAPDEPVRGPEPAPAAQPVAADPVMQDDPAIEGAMILDAFGETGETSERAMEDHAGPVSGLIMAAGSSVSLPPGLVQAAVSPFIVLEVLIGTLFDSLESMLLPLIVLVAVSSAFIWRETRQAREASA